MPLTDFLASEPKLVTVRATNWSEIVDNEEAETKQIVLDIGALPTAPRGAVDIDYSNVPSNPPFVAHVANLSFEIDDDGLKSIFGDLNTISARVIRDGTRSRGIGLVEFETREHLIEGLKRTDKEVYGRKIRVSVSDKTDSHHHEGGRNFGNRSHRMAGGNSTGEERPGMSERWKRAEPRPDDGFNDRRSNRDGPNREFSGRSNMNRGSRDNPSGNDFGFGYPNPRGEDRGGPGGSGGSGRDYNRQGQRNRYQNDDERSNSGMDRPRYSGRYSDTRDVRDRNKPNDETHDDQRETQRERPRLHLQPRTKPVESLQPLSGSSSSVNNVAANVNDSSISNADETTSLTNTSGHLHDSSHEQRDDNQPQDSNDDSASTKPSRGAGASIFGGAKPVDTAARELEIERKMKEMQMATNETTNEETQEKPAPQQRSFNRNQDRDTYRTKRSSQNDDHQNRERDRDRDRRDDGRYGGHGSDYHHKREHSGGRQYEDDPRKRSDDDHPPPSRRGGSYGGQSRRDNESGRTNRYNPPNRDDRGGNSRYPHRDRDDRHGDNNEFTPAGRSSSNNFNSDSQSRHPQRGLARRTLPAEDDSHKLQLSNKFGMLGDDEEELDDGDENNEAQSPSIEE